MKTNGEFDYETFWKLQEPQVRPHEKRALDLGLHFDDVPMCATMFKYTEAKNKIAELYNEYELLEAGIDLDLELSTRPYEQVLELIEESGVELSITISEVMHLMADQEHTVLKSIVVHNTSTYAPFRETLPGFGEDSAFKSNDYLKTLKPYEVDKFAYFAQKVCDYGKDIAIQHSAVCAPEGKQYLLKKFISLINSKFRNRALWLHNSLMSLASVDEISARRKTIVQLNVQIARMKMIWREYA